MKKSIKNKKQQSPSKILVGGLIFSLMLLAFVLVFKHKLFESDEPDEGPKIEMLRDKKNAIEEKVKTEVKDKLQITK